MELQIGAFVVVLVIGPIWPMYSLWRGKVEGLGKKQLIVALVAGFVFGTGGPFLSWALSWIGVGRIGGFIGYPGFLLIIWFMNVPFDSISYFPVSYIAINALFYAMVFGNVYLIYTRIRKPRLQG